MREDSVANLSCEYQRISRAATAVWKVEHQQTPATTGGRIEQNKINILAGQECV